MQQQNAPDAMPRLCLAVLITHPIQYFAPLFRAIAKRNKVDLHVLYLSDRGSNAYHDSGFDRSVQWDIPLLEGYASTILEPQRQPGNGTFWSRHSPRLRQQLEKLRPDALLVFGYASRMNWTAVRWAKAHSCKVLYFSDSNDARRAAVPKRWLKQAIVRTFFASVDTFLCVSEANASYVQRFGASQRHIRRMPFAIEVDRFRHSAAPRPNKPSVDFVWAGKFTPRKRAADFIAALPLVAEQTGQAVRAKLVGDGEQSAALRSQAAQLPPSCSVDFTGFINQQAMPAQLASGPIFVFTSEQEAYGLAATEAAAAGLALVIAEKIGCVGPTVLARPGHNALLYPAGDVHALAEAMSTLLLDRPRRRQMQQASRRIAAEHDVSVAAEAIENAAQTWPSAEPAS